MMSEAVSILLSNCDGGCNPRILFGGARIVLISKVQDLGLVTLPVPVVVTKRIDPGRRGRGQGCLARWPDNLPFRGQKEELQIATSQNAPFTDMANCPKRKAFTNKFRFVYPKVSMTSTRLPKLRICFTSSA